MTRLIRSPEARRGLEPRPPLFDLHVHTIRSDGLWSPMQLGELARRSGLAGLAITDHDTLPETEHLETASRASGVRFLPGVELSTELDGRGLHLLAYGFDPRDSTLRALCGELRELRLERWRALIAWIQRKGIKLDGERIARIPNRSTPGRLHLARELVAARIVGGVRAAFARYLSEAELCTPAARVPAARAISTVHGAGGVAILAHPPMTLRAAEWQALFFQGLDGIETHHPALRNAHRRFLDQLALENKLRTTGGSDFHGDDPREGLGQCSVDEAHLSQILLGTWPTPMVGSVTGR